MLSELFGGNTSLQEKRSESFLESFLTAHNNSTTQSHTVALPNIIDLINVQVFTCEMNIVVVGHFDTMLHFERPNISTFNGAWDMQHRNWFSF